MHDYNVLKLCVGLYTLYVWNYATLSYCL